jgi:hypothetical protein
MAIERCRGTDSEVRWRRWLVGGAGEGGGRVALEAETTADHGRTHGGQRAGSRVACRALTRSLQKL